MKTKLFLIAISLLFCNLSFAQTIVSGNVSGTWNLDGSPYIITGNIYVANHLTIDSGVSVQFFAGGWKIEVGSGDKFLANGTANSPIVFEPFQGVEPGSWNKIYFNNSGQDDTLAHCIVRFGTTGIHSYRSEPTILNSSIYGNSSTGIYFKAEYGIYDASVVSSIIRDNGGYGIYVCGYDHDATGRMVVVIDYCQIYNNASNGVDIYSGTYWNWGNGYALADINNSLILNNPIGVRAYAYRGHADAKLTNTIVAYNGIGVKNQDSNSQIGANDILYNCFWSNSENNFSGISQPNGFGSNGNYQNLNGDSCDINFNIYNDPVFVDTPNSNYQLESNSKCIDAGTNIVLGAFRLDPDGTIPDIGAFYFDQLQIQLDAAFSVSNTLTLTGTSIQFTDLSTGEPTNWLWDFENDGTVDSIVQNPSWTYDEPGAYTVSLTVNDDAKASSTETKEDYICVFDAVSIITQPVSKSACVGDNPYLFVEASGDSLTYRWQKNEVDISDSDNDTLFIALVQLSDTGNYRCIVTNPASADTSEIATLTVHPLPYFFLGNDTTICRGETIIFDAGAGYADYEWNDGSTQQTLMADTAGIYWVDVSTIYGCNTRDSIELFINEIPLANLEFNQSCTDYLIDFSDMSTSGGGEISSWSWDFGDTSSNQDTSSLQNPEFYYSQSGYYYVNLQVTDINGCIHDTIKTIQVIEDLMIELGENFTACEGHTIDIAPDITGGLLPFDFYWIAASDTISTDPILSILINSDTTITLQVCDANGCQADDDLAINISQVYDGEEICLVTVDTVTGKNMIVWEKTDGQGTAYYNIYRKEGGTFDSITSVDFDSLSVFIDTTSTPLVHAFSYKIAAVDSCGNTSELSELQKTMHLSVSEKKQDDVELIWNLYEGFYYEYIDIYRGSTESNLVKIAEVENDLESYTDQNPPIGEIIYKVGVEKVSACHVDGSKAGPFKQSLSNIADNVIKQEFAFTAGWNSISSYIEPANADVGVMFNDIVDDLTILKSLDGIYWPDDSINTIGNWDSESGYALKMDSDTVTVFEITGIEEASPSLLLQPGWAYMPSLNQCETNVWELFWSSQNHIVIVQDLIGTNVFWPEMEIYTLDTILPGHAYKINIQSPVFLTFPECDNKKQIIPKPQANSISSHWGEIQMNPITHLLAFDNASLAQILPGDQIGAFNSYKQLCGTLEVISTKENSSITLFGDDPITKHIDGLTEGEPLNFKLYRPSSNETFDLDVEYDASYDSDGIFKVNGISVISDVKLSAVSVNESQANNIRIYPNPTEGKLEIIIEGLNEKLSGRIFDLQKNEYRQFEMDGSKQEMRKQLNLSGLPAGIYLISITGESFRYVEKVVVM